MKVTHKKFLADLIAAIFIFLFVYTAVNKILSYSSFEATLQQTPVFKNYSAFIAWIVPAAELAVSGLLFFPATRTKGLYASLVLMSGFTLYISAMLLFSPDLPCSCGGVIQQLTWQQHLGFNVFFTLLAGLAIRIQQQKLRTAPAAVPV